MTQTHEARSPSANTLMEPPVGKSIRQVITEVGAKHGFSYIEMVCHRRPAALCRARQEAYWRCMKETIFSLPLIGRHFGNRDHTTIMYGAKLYAQRRAAGEPDVLPEETPVAPVLEQSALEKSVGDGAP